MTDVEDFPTVNNYIKPFNIANSYEVLKRCILKILDPENKINTREEVLEFIKKYQRENSVSIGHAELLYTYRVLCDKENLEYDQKYEILLQKKTFRSQSGVMVFTVVLSPYPNGQKFSCEFDCKYCPLQPGQPRSYLKEEPGVQRANRYNFDPVMQIRDRAFSYITNGHPVDKAEVIVLGGTWSSYPEDYQIEFITKVYYACNTFFDDLDVSKVRTMKSLQDEMKINETTKLKVIGLTLETRPDCINDNELKKFRMLGVTRIQLGIQHINNRILERIDRRCNSKHAIKAIKKLKDNCFKVDCHWMPDLPKPLKLSVSEDMKNGVVSYKKKLEHDDIDWDFDVYEADKLLFETITTHPDWQVDQWKIYPAEVTPHTALKEEYERGLHVPYGESFIDHPKINKYTKLHELLIYAKSLVPEHIRLNRIIRDIPSNYILGGATDVSMRQVLQLEMKRRGLFCKCIRCKEVKKQNIDPSTAKLFVKEFESSKGTEFYLSFKTEDEQILFGFLRLRIVQNNSFTIFDDLKDCALIRELHVYGQTTATYSNTNGKHVQHVGFGTKLLNKAFEIAQAHKFKKIAVISGNGVKNYYRKFGFIDTENFLVKTFDEIVQPINTKLNYFNVFYSFCRNAFNYFSSYVFRFCSRLLK